MSPRRGVDSHGIELMALYFTASASHDPWMARHPTMPGVPICFLDASPRFPGRIVRALWRFSSFGRRHDRLVWRSASHPERLCVVQAAYVCAIPAPGLACTTPGNECVAPGHLCWHPSLSCPGVAPQTPRAASTRCYRRKSRPKADEGTGRSIGAHRSAGFGSRHQMIRA
jgi:hypothetical protein